MKILFLISEREIILTGGRFLQLIYRLNHHQVTLASNSNRVLNHCESNLKYVNKILLKPQEYLWTMQQRDKFAEKFINTFHDIKLAEDMPMWKAEAFDDFLWNVSQFVYPQIKGQFDLIIMPIPSKEEAPPHLVDEFYTAQIFKAKKENIPICGLELLPLQFIPILFTKIIDYFIVKTDTSRQFLNELHNIPNDKMWVLNYQPDLYSLETIEDPFKHYLFKTIQPPRNELNIVVMNHVKKREELKEVIETLAILSIKVNLHFSLINYAVKELHEMQIINDLIIPTIKKHFTKVQFVDVLDLPQLLTSMDGLISMDYMTLFKWAENYDIPCLIYSNKENLKEQLEFIWSLKKQQIGLSDVMDQIEKEKTNVL